MPQTRFTNFCHECYDLIGRLHQFAVDRVLPAILDLRHDGSRIDVKRDIAVFSTYSRIIDWLGSLGRLNETSDAQAIGAGARAVFELYLDLRWFGRFPEPEWAARWAAFSEVDRYQAAQKAVKHAASTPNSQFNAGAQQGFIDRLNAREPVEDLVRRIWGSKPDGSPRWPRFHWTGQPNLEDRSRVLGVEFQDAYRQIYPVLSSLVHPGPTAYVGKSFEEFELHVGYAYFYTFKHAYDATLFTVNLLGIAGTIVNFDAAMEQLARWLNEAMETLGLRA